MEIAKSILIIICISALSSSMPSFGMNKPHMLFHLGDRKAISLNIGWGYWAGSGPNRLKFKNTNEGIYATMQAHDGKTFFHQSVEDRTQKVQSDLKYLLREDDWQTEITMENVGSQRVTWYVYTSVENNDYRFVDHQGYSSFIAIKPKVTSENTVELSCQSNIYPPQKISIERSSPEENNSGKDSIKVFGITANISQTFTINEISSQFKHLVQVWRGEDVERVGDNATLVWEEKQLQMMRKNEWEQKSYVVLFTYAEIMPGDKFKIQITNSSTPSKFDDAQFQKRDEELTAKYQHEDPEFQSFLKHTISNLYGGITFYYGRLYTQNSLLLHSQDYSYSFTPSRLIFPRSFLWDDGFHQSVIAHYDPETTIDMLMNWMNKVDLFGWIGREQIRGGDVTSMMPDSRFVFQDWFQMNPPTLLLPILALMRDQENLNQETHDKFMKFLRGNYRKLESWYRYFKITQSHHSLDYEETMDPDTRFFRWQCKDQCSRGNFMGSGLDDYPRTNTPDSMSKQHVDMLSWLYFFSNTLDNVAEFIEGGQPVRQSRRRAFYKKESQKYLQQIYENMRDDSDGLFKDVAVEKTNLFVEEFVNTVGYINLFPFFTGMLRAGVYDNEQKRVDSLKSTLRIMTDEQILLSQDGLRSLSLSDRHYGTEDNYWRGAVWMPINYMVLRACKLYYWEDQFASEKIQNFYKELRGRIIRSVHENFKQRGYLFENYYEGKGHRGFPFYGWTSLIANIITENY